MRRGSSSQSTGVVLDDVETIAAYAQDMSEFLNESELTERRAFIETFVKEIVVIPGNALMHYTVPMPHDSLIPGRNAEQMPLNGSVLSTVQNGGPTCTVLSLSQKGIGGKLTLTQRPDGACGVGGGRDIAAVQETGQGSGSPSRGLETWEELHTRRRVRRLKAVTNMFHSAATLARPRSRNLRAPCCSLMIPKTGSTSCFLSP